MDLLDRYLQAVRKYLPARRQDDIIAELRANMESQIEDKESELGRPLTQGEMEDLLRKMGHPMLVASRYQPQQFLIGPTLFPMYLYVLRLTMLWAFVICMIVTVVVTPLTSPGARAIFESLLRMPGILIQTAAWITLVFVALDFFRARYPNSFPTSTGISTGVTKNWNPSTLPPLEKDSNRPGKRRSFAQAVAEIIFSSLFLVYLLLIPSHPFLMLGPGVVFLKVMPYELSPAWWTFFWWIIALNIVQIVSRCVDLVRNTWQQPGRLQQIVLKVFGLIPVVILLMAPGHIYVSLKNPALDQARYGQNLDQINNGIHYAFVVICAIVLLQLIFDVGKWAWEARRARLAAE
ncbi:MAG TPA: hypothetical protein VK574_02080 [Terracidiphilus sp.]|nr:hypothetical protein [Terracidiphilus sp.]